MWTRFDELSERHGIQKMETVGYTYMAVGGLLSGGQNVQAAEITRMALDCCEEASNFMQPDGTPDPHPTQDLTLDLTLTLTLNL